MKKNVTITLVLLFVLASCQKNVVEYPVFYWPNKGIELDYTLTFDNCQFNSLCNEKVKAALLAFVEHSSYDSYILDIEQKGDSVGFVATGHDLSFLLYSLVKERRTNVWMTMSHVAQDSSNEIKTIFLPRIATNLKVTNKTGHATIMKPQYVRLGDDEYWIRYPSVTELKGYLLNDSLHIDQFCIDGKKKQRLQDSIEEVRK